MSNRTRREGLRCNAALCSTLLWLSACFATHGPQDATETGNPPVIDSGRVALKIGSSAVHITGEKGAVTPGGTPIEITNLATGMVTKASAKADGSFDVQVDGSPNDAFVVRAGTGDTKSSAVYVVRGGAVVSSGKNDTLSCEQRDQLAGAQLQLAAMSADTHCSNDSDCGVVLELASCHDRCQYAIVSQQGAAAINATSAAIDAGLCSSYAQDGCTNVLLPCVSPPSVICSAGQCVQAGPGPGPGSGTTLSCQDRAQMAGDQIAQAVQAADKSCTVDADCVVARASAVCTSDCPGYDPVASQAGSAAIEAVVSSINSGLCASFASDGCTVATGPCMSPPMVGDPACMSGQCTRSTSPPFPSNCMTCLTETIEWGPKGSNAMYVDHSVLAPCIHYTHGRHPLVDPTSTTLSCEDDLEACDSYLCACAGITSTGAVLHALADADVKQALDASPVTYGNDQALDAPVFEIKVGTGVVNVASSCDGAPPNCIPPPAGVQALVDLLQTIDKVELATPECSGFSP